MNEKEVAEFFKDIEFLEFISREAEKMLAHTTDEDLAIFGFGSVEDAIEAFKEKREG